MLLYLEDYETQGGCLQTNTKNLSFIRTVFLLEKMGIKNNKFFLHLTQPELANYDPHNLKDPSQELVGRIAHECKVNIWYFLREVIRIGASGSNPIPYQLNRANLAMTWCFMNSFDMFITMVRQMGKSIGAIALYDWSMYFGFRNSVLGMFAKDDKLIQANVKRIKDIRDALPPYLIAKSVHDTDNKEGLSYAALNNEYKTYVAQADKISAMKQARGDTEPLQHWDEFAYYKNNDLSYPAAAAAMDTAGELAFNAGLPTCKIITTTAGMLSNPAGAFAFKIKSHAARFRESIYDMQNRAAVVEYLKKESTNMMFYLEFSHRQLGKDDEWLKKVTADKDEITIKTDYLNIWLSGTGSNVVPEALLERISKSVVEPVEYSTISTLTVYWYVAKDIILDDVNKMKYYIIGCDTSDCINEDYTTFVVIDPSDLGIIATCRVNTASFVHVAGCAQTLLEMLPNAIFVPERNKNGAVLIDILIDKLVHSGISPFRRIYNTFIQDWSSTSKDLDKIDLSSGVNRKRFGFNTTASTRDDLYGNVLINMLNIMADRVYDYNLSEELKALSVRDGRIDHSIGGHDDLTMSMMLAGWFALYAKNHNMYGIPGGSILNGVTNEGSSVDPETKLRHQLMYKRIKELRSMIQYEQNGIRKATYERELKALEELFNPSMVKEDHVTVNAIHEEAKECVIDNDFVNRLKFIMR